MRPMLPLLLVLGVPFTIGCASAGTTADVQTTDPASQAPLPPTIPDASPSGALDPDVVPADAVIVVRRAGGVGAVLYTLAVHADGRVEYEGVNLVAVTGARSTSTTPQTVAALWRAFVSLDRDQRALLESCSAGSFDDASAYTIVLESGPDRVRFSGALDAPCDDNAAHRELVEQYAELVSAAGATDWLGDAVR